jgi:hypothetical protein
MELLIIMVAVVMQLMDPFAHVIYTLEAVARQIMDIIIHVVHIYAYAIRLVTDSQDAKVIRGSEKAGTVIVMQRVILRRANATL